jgi:hypothetical protein
MVQIDVPKLHVCIQFRDDSRMQDMLHSTIGQAEYRHNNWEISMVRIETTGLVSRKVRIANLPRKCLMEYYGQSWSCMEKSKKSRRRTGHTHIATRWQMVFDSPFKNEGTSCL